MEVDAPPPPHETQLHSLPVEDGFDQSILGEVIASGSLGFDDWTFLISDVEAMAHEDIETLSLVYGSFLSKFPLCHIYWKRYADHQMRLCGPEKAVEVFEQAVLAVTYSVGLWDDYCQFASSVFEDPDDVRRLFKRAVSFVGKDYSCHSLWDKYIDFEFSKQDWSSLAHIFIQALSFPTKKLHHYYQSFEKLVAIWEEEMQSQGYPSDESKPEIDLDNELQASNNSEEIYDVIRRLLDSSDGHTRLRDLQLYKATGERLYKNSCTLDEKILCFESNIRRSYFHMKPLDTVQLENWHKYLDFVEGQKDFDWAVKLYERCLIPAANYSEFWMRYVIYVEGKGGIEIANFALDRATKIFLQDMPMMHLCSARFKEASGDIMGARAALLQLETESDENFVDNVIIKASMEKRLGNPIAASNIYREAIDRTISKKDLNLLPNLYVHYAQHLYVTTNCAVTARDILIEGIKHMPSSKMLYEELIRFAMTHGGEEHIDVVGAIVNAALNTTPGELPLLDSTDQKYISNLYLKFVDICGTIYDIRKAWNQHMKIFPLSVQAAYVSLPTGTKTWKSLLERKRETFADGPSESIDVRLEEPSLSGNAISSPKAVSVGNDSSERGQQASNKSLEQSMENEAESVEAPTKISEEGTAKPDHDHVVDLHQLPVPLETLSLDPPEDRPSRSVSDRSRENDDPEELSVSNRFILSRNQAFDRGESERIVSTPPPSSSGYQTQNDSSFESRPQERQMNYSEQPHRDKRFGTHGNLRRRTHQHQQLNPPQAQYPNAVTGPASYPPQSQQVSGNQLQGWPAPNYNFVPGYSGQVPLQNAMYPQGQFPNYPSLQGSEQSAGNSQSSQAYYNQICQYYYYYQQQQLFIQQQMQQLQLRQAQLQQQQQSPEYQEILQQLTQLQQQQQYVYLYQQQLYQQMQMLQQQQPPLQQQQQQPPSSLQQQPPQSMRVAQQDEHLNMQQQLPLQRQSLQHKQLDQLDQSQVQPGQELAPRHRQPSIRQEELEGEEGDIEAHHPESTL